MGTKRLWTWPVQNPQKELDSMNKHIKNVLKVKRHEKAFTTQIDVMHKQYVAVVTVTITIIGVNKETFASYLEKPFLTYLNQSLSKGHAIMKTTKLEGFEQSQNKPASIKMSARMFGLGSSHAAQVKSLGSDNMEQLENKLSKYLKNAVNDMYAVRLNKVAEFLTNSRELFRPDFIEGVKNKYLNGRSYPEKGWVSLLARGDGQSRIRELPAHISQYCIELDDCMLARRNFKLYVSIGEDSVSVNSKDCPEDVPKEILYQVKFSDDPDRCFLVFDKSVVEASKSMPSVLNTLNVFQTRQIHGFMGYGYSLGDFVIRLGVIKVNADFQRALFCELEHTSCMDAKGGQAMLLELFKHIAHSESAKKCAESSPEEPPVPERGLVMEVGLRRLAQQYVAHVNSSAFQNLA